MPAAGRGGLASDRAQLGHSRAVPAAQQAELGRAVGMAAARRGRTGSGPASGATAACSRGTPEPPADPADQAIGPLGRRFPSAAASSIKAA